ncbi:uncharacterized protein TNCV_2611181 [Trichonephila clavipes]|nr:uncharacterized protein TNCV_2611181 [Trichonephila clavipes]
MHDPTGTHCPKVLRQSSDLIGSLARSFADSKHVDHGCSMSDPGYTPSCHNRSTLATWGSCLDRDFRSFRDDPVFTDANLCDQHCFSRRGLIIGIKTAGWSTRRVAGQVDRLECADRNCREQWTREGTHAWKTGSGETRKTTRREDRRIVRQALVDPTVTRSTIRADVGVAFVPQTISRYLAEANLISKRPFRAPPLTPEHRQLRLQWCQARSMWNVTDWQKVVFSDESRFVLGTDDNRVRLWRRLEHVWDQLKRQMASCHSVHDLELAVQDVWAHLPQHNIWCLINSMPDRVVACIAAGGGPIEVAIEVAQYLCRCTPCIRLIVLFLRSSESLICVIMCIKFDFNPMLTSWVAIFIVPVCIDQLLIKYPSSERSEEDSGPPRYCGLSFRKIGSRVGRNQTTVMRIRDRWVQEGMTHRHGRSHPPQCTTSRKDRQIVSMAVTDRSVTSRTVAQDIGPRVAEQCDVNIQSINQAQDIESLTHHSVSARTIRRRLQQSDLSARRPLLGLPLTQNHRCLRCEWCDERRMWAAEWNEVVFTDESRNYLQHHDGRIRVWGHHGERMLNTTLVLHRVLWYGRYWISLSHYSSTHCRYFKTASATCPRCLSQLSFLNFRAWPQPYFNKTMLDHTWHALSKGSSSIIRLSYFPGRLTLQIFRDRKHVAYGCSTIDPDYPPLCHTRSTFAKCAS